MLQPSPAVYLSACFWQLNLKAHAQADEGRVSAGRQVPVSPQPGDQHLMDVPSCLSAPSMLLVIPPYFFTFLLAAMSRPPCWQILRRQEAPTSILGFFQLHWTDDSSPNIQTLVVWECIAVVVFFSFERVKVNNRCDYTKQLRLLLNDICQPAVYYRKRTS